MPEKEVPARLNLEQYRKQAKDLAFACRLRTPESLVRVRRHHPHFKDATDETMRHAPVKLADAQVVIARENGFASWPKFVAFLKVVCSSSSDVSAFESAVDAIVSGDVDVLRRLLEQHPGLTQMRSTRAHHAALLHYVGANGVEENRQKTPSRILAITRLLLDAGASVNAVCDLYGGTTTLDLVGSSIHPKQAGVQTELLQLLLDRGAKVTWRSEAGKDHSAIKACLANGRKQAAEYLGARQESLNLEEAAGLGRLDVVKTFFHEDGTPLSSASPNDLQRGLLWASEYGRTDVIEFLLDHGADLYDDAGTGQSCVHWAVIGGHLPTIEFLIKRGADLERLNQYGGTALGQAIWSHFNGDGNTDYVSVIEVLAASGAKVDKQWLAWVESGKDRADEATARLAEILRQAASG